MKNVNLHEKSRKKTNFYQKFQSPFMLGALRTPHVGRSRARRVWTAWVRVLLRRREQRHRDQARKADAGVRARRCTERSNSVNAARADSFFVRYLELFL